MLVDDNPADIVLSRETLEETKLRITCVAAADGQHALEQLEACLDRREKLPDLILLDLNMPRLDGCELLAKLREHDAFRAIVVAILSSSDARQDIVRSYKLGANCFVNKPVGLAEFQKIVECFWPTFVKLL